jgi:hypothetical protein
MACERNYNNEAAQAIKGFPGNIMAVTLSRWLLEIVD